MANPDFRQLSAKYQQKLDQSLNPDSNLYGVDVSDGKTTDEEKRLLEQNESVPTRVESREYEQFKKENLPAEMNWYESGCQMCEGLLKIQPDAKRAKDLQKAIDDCHLNITPAGAASFAMLVPLVVAIIGSVIGYLLFDSLFLVGFSAMAAFALMVPLGNIPFYMQTNWRMKASKQMVLSVFYVVTYMRHTSNLENAIQFAGEHLAPPLSLDFKRVIWNVQTEKFSTVKESLDDYLENWRETNMEFVESMHLIESSLFEGSENRRLDLLDKSLDVILEGTFEKMLHFAQNLKAPINTLNMLGVILPILGLVLLPLIVSFMGDVKWFHIAALYNIALPAAVYGLGRSILQTRPSGSGGQADSVKMADPTKTFDLGGGLKFTMGALGVAVTVGIILLVIGVSPVLIHLMNPNFDISILTDRGFQIVMGNDPYASYKFIDYQPLDGSQTGEMLGPFGLGASLLSIFVPMALGVGIATFYRMRSQNVLKIREESKKLELEFSSALFQLGNRLADGFPAELVFGKVAEIMQGTVSGKFFATVDNNIKKLGMSVNDAIFDKKTGAVAIYPSALIESSMKVLIQSVKKGPKIAAQAMANVARYVKEIHKVNERLKDLMAEVVSSMNSQVKFLSPAISGIVVGITCMITSILGRLGSQMKQMSTMSGGSSGGLMEMFGQGLPTFQFQIIVGIYVVQLAYILTVITNGIENGEDKLAEEYMIGQNVWKSTMLYCTISFIVMFLFNMVASAILQGPTSAIGG